jgi:hypothetical protein
VGGEGRDVWPVGSVCRACCPVTTTGPLNLRKVGGWGVGRWVSEGEAWSWCRSGGLRVVGWRGRSHLCKADIWYAGNSLMAGWR